MTGDDLRDPSRPVREEDAFDVEAVAAWLREHATAFRDDLVGTPEVRQFPGGASNLTYLLTYPGRDADPAPPAGRGRRPRAPTTWAASTASRPRSRRSSPTSRRWSGCAPTSR